MNTTHITPLHSPSGYVRVSELIPGQAELVMGRYRYLNATNMLLGVRAGQDRKLKFTDLSLALLEEFTRASAQAGLGSVNAEKLLGDLRPHLEAAAGRYTRSTPLFVAAFRAAAQIVATAVVSAQAARHMIVLGERASSTDADTATRAKSHAGSQELDITMSIFEMLTALTSTEFSL